MKPLQYTSDPAWEQPDLRSLLPAFPCVVQAEGWVRWHGHTYGEPWLTAVLHALAGKRVAFHPAAYTTAYGWISWHGSVLTIVENSAVKRTDGSLRTTWQAGIIPT